MIIDFDHSNDVNQRNIDKLIGDTIKESQRLEELSNELPAMITGYITFRKILRHVKRCRNFEEAVKIYAFDSCPPEKTEETMCGEIPCAECWRQFCGRYAEEARKKN